ncbi:MAG: histidine triad nucleotide-binding protein [Acidobacteria bacterium]|nr:MAG: histidine triad nucleotide-binding protein [Acidobacteriota bacterium]PIE89808.1 MAG: histidine triad nucleotide-binding protein [Acidobacteriota bacterium]
MTIFQKILDGQIPADIVFRDDEVCAFRDIAPQAPVHILVIPVKPLASISKMGEEDVELIGKLFKKATEIAESEGLSDYRLVLNNGEGAGQTVFHLHLHILGGREFSWPPG